jgi:uncharacterized cupredoxin-like copper-binding protein
MVQDEFSAKPENPFAAQRELCPERSSPRGRAELQSTSTRRTVAAIVGAIVVAVIAVGAVSLAGSLGGNDGSAKKSAAAPRAAASPGVVDVRLTDFKIKPATSSAPAGKVTFVAANAGATKHEMVVIRTDKPAGALLKGSEASETGAVDEIEDIGAGKTQRLSVDLKPGHYALICNLPGHYKAGMFADFTVK